MRNDFILIRVAKNLKRALTFIDGRDVGKGILSYTEGRKMNYFAFWGRSLLTSIKL